MTALSVSSVQGLEEQRAAHKQTSQPLCGLGVGPEQQGDSLQQRGLTAAILSRASRRLPETQPEPSHSSLPVTPN